MSTVKISITMDEADLAWLRRRAKRLHGGNLSAVFAEATEATRKNEALAAFLDEAGVPPVTPEQLEEITAEWRGVPRAPKRRRKK